ncbi:acetate/propionate family kinase [Candidatus Kaiserbacteria bacterium]|nr:acetate/propionate family kinase [Candidatus Kaiserbacteria bacterium]
MSAILVVNPGSSSRKYALYCDGAAEVVWEAEMTGTTYQLCTQVRGSNLVCDPLNSETYAAIFTRIAHEVNEYIAAHSTTLAAVAVRVTVPGTALQQHAIVDAAYIQTLHAQEHAAPLTVPAVIRAIQSAQHHFADTPVVAVSDSAFHATLPTAARTYSLPKELFVPHDLYRFGYHGLSVASIVHRIHAVTGADPERMIVCHLGDTMSVTAVQNGKSFDTTTGFSMTGGLPMGSRGGDIDTMAMLELMRATRMSPTDAELLLTTRCGMAGLSGESDLRTVMARRAAGDTAATVAIERLVREVQRAIGAMAATLGGLDMVIFTASAGVRSSELRTMICSKLTHLGLLLSEERNVVTISRDGVISERNSPAKIVVMRTDEMGEMAAVATSLCRSTT